MNQREIILSIIVPVHNTVFYLKKCLDSLVHQTIKQKEIIVVDDGSDEDILSVITEYDSAEIIYIRNEVPQGPGGARNRGLEIAKGKYIGFCDSDDWVELNLYEEAVYIVEKHKADIGMFSQKRDIDHSAEPTYNCFYDKEYWVNSDMAIRIMTKQYDMGITISTHCTNKIFRKEFLDEINAKFEEDIYFQTPLFALYTFMRTNKTVCVPRVCCRHYRRTHSIIQSFNQKHITDYKTSMQLMQKYLTDCNKFEIYRYNYYNLCEHYLNLVVKEIFLFVYNEQDKKKYLWDLLHAFMTLIPEKEYFEYCNAEKIRKHIQPYVDDISL